MPQWPKNPYRPLTNVSNVPDAKDVYGNVVWKQGDEFPPFSTRDPAGSGSARLGVGIGAARAGDLEVENPLGGDITETAGGLYCETCNRAISIAEMALPAHLEHNTRYSYGKDNLDISNASEDNIARCGGEYNIGWEAIRYSPALPGTGTVEKSPDSPMGPQNKIPGKSLPADTKSVNPVEFNEGSFAPDNHRTGQNLNAYRPINVSDAPLASLDTIADQIVDKTVPM